MNLDEIDPPKDILSSKYGPRLDRLIMKHNKVVEQYDKLKQEYDGKGGEILEQFMRDNIEYAFQGGCRHTKRYKKPWMDTNTLVEYCSICNKFVDKNRFYACKEYMSQDQADRYLKLWQRIYKTFKDFRSFDCEHEYCD